MLDHLFGRPSNAYKRLRVLIITYLTLNLNRIFLGQEPWKIVIYTLLAAYVAQNSFLLLFLNGPEPLKKMYTRSFFRATWILTSLDAGFFTAMNIPFKPLRDVLSVVFSIGYLFFPDAANEKVKKYPASVKTSRTSWEKSTNPIFRAITYFDRGYLKIRRDIIIPRPKDPSPSSFEGTLPPVKARFYFNGTPEELKNSKQLIFAIHGGGFVCMEPRHHDDYLSSLCRSTKNPIVCINYGKAPEFPYPWALEECFDAYRTIVEGRGECLGMGGSGTDKTPIKVVIMGDSAGGALVTGVVMKLIEWHHSPSVPLPVSVLLCYPALSFEFSGWMSAEQMDLLEQDKTSGVLRVVKSKVDIRLNEPLAHNDAPRKIDIIANTIDDAPSWYKKYESPFPLIRHINNPDPVVHSNLSMTSRVAFFNDRILPAETMRSMALMYLASSPLKPDITKDYYLSPLQAPEIVLARFPKIFFICGEKDPLVDDTVVFAARLRRAKAKAHSEWERLREQDTKNEPPLSPKHSFSKTADSQIKVKLLPGMSHGFLQFSTFLPESPQTIKVLHSWIQEGFKESSMDADDDDRTTTQRVLGGILGGILDSADEQGVFMRRRDSMVSKLFPSMKSK